MYEYIYNNSIYDSPIYMYLNLFYFLNIKKNGYAWQIFYHFVSKRHNFCDFLFAFVYTSSLLRKGFLTRKEFAPLGSKFFPFRVELFSKGRQTIFD